MPEKGKRRSDPETHQLSVPRGTLNESRWNEILTVAEEVLFEKGYKDATVQEIAARVGLLKGSLYYYIQNKEDLLFQVLARANMRHLRGLQDDPGISTGDAVTRLSHFIDRHMDQIYSNRRWAVVNRVDQLALEAERMASLNAIRYQIQQVLKDIITHGIAEGTFDPNIDVSIAANSILSLMNDTILWYQPSGRRSLHEIAEWYKTFILKGLALDEPPPERDTVAKKAGGKRWNRPPSTLRAMPVS